MRDICSQLLRGGVLAAVCLLGLPGPAPAQQPVVQPGRTARIGTDGLGTGPTVLDGTPLLEEGNRRFGELWLQRGLAAGAPAAIAAQAYEVGDRKEFWAIDFSKGLSFPYTQYQVEAECRAVGDHAYYFVEVLELGNVSNTELQEFVDSFETSSPSGSRDPDKGTYENITEVFGTPPDIDGDPRIVLLLTRIPSIAQQADDDRLFAGYFYSANQSSTDPVDFGGGVRQRSNQTEMMYVNAALVGYENTTDPSLQTYFRSLVKGTIAHEFQHLIQFANDPLETTAVNEGLSEYASYLCGYGLRNFTRFVSRPNVDLFTWQTYSGTLDDYARVAVWTYYLGQRFGEGFITALATSPARGREGVQGVLTSHGGGALIGDVLADFGAALWLGDPTAISPWDLGEVYGWLEPERHENLYPSRHRVTLEPNGVTAVRFWNAAGLSLAFPDGLPTGVAARLVRRGDSGWDVTEVTGPMAITGMGTTWREAALVLANGAATRTTPFRVEAAATQGSEGLVRYETGRPMIRFYNEEDPWEAGARIQPEVGPSRIRALWYFLSAVGVATVEVRRATPDSETSGGWVYETTPIFSTPVTPFFQGDGWLRVPVPDLGLSLAAGEEYLVSIRLGSNSLGYEDLTRGAGRSVLRERAPEDWIRLSTQYSGETPLLGEWMIRAEFAYEDTTPPTAGAAVLQHPLFPEQAEVVVGGSEPLHPGLTSGTFTMPGGAPVSLLFEHTLGAYGILDPTPVLLQAGTAALEVIAFDRYGGFSDTLSVQAAVAPVGAGRSALLLARTETGTVRLEVPAGLGGETTLLMIPYPADARPPGGPDEWSTVAGAPLVSITPANWSAPGEGAELRLPLAMPGPGPWRLERWDGGAWQPLATAVRSEAGQSVGSVPGGGWYRLAAGPPPLAEGVRSRIELLGNQPNPFNPQTRIRFRVPAERAGARARLTVLNARGQQVAVLLDGAVGSGEQSVVWDGRNDQGRPVASGIYLYRLEVAGEVFTRKMVLLR